MSSTATSVKGLAKGRKLALRSELETTAAQFKLATSSAKPSTAVRIAVMRKSRLRAGVGCVPIKSASAGMIGKM